MKSIAGSWKRVIAVLIALMMTLSIAPGNTAQAAGTQITVAIEANGGVYELKDSPTGSLLTTTYWESQYDYGDTIGFSELRMDPNCSSYFNGWDLGYYDADWNFQKLYTVGSNQDLLNYVFNAGVMKGSPSNRYSFRANWSAKSQVAVLAAGGTLREQFMNGEFSDAMFGLFSEIIPGLSISTVWNPNVANSNVQNNGKTLGGWYCYTGTAAGSSGNGGYSIMKDSSGQPVTFADIATALASVTVTAGTDYIFYAKWNEDELNEQLDGMGNPIIDYSKTYDVILNASPVKITGTLKPIKNPDFISMTDYTIGAYVKFGNKVSTAIEIQSIPFEANLAGWKMYYMPQNNQDNMGLQPLSDRLYSTQEMLDYIVTGNELSGVNACTEQANNVPMLYFCAQWNNLHSVQFNVAKGSQTGDYTFTDEWNTYSNRNSVGVRTFSGISISELNSAYNIADVRKIGSSAIFSGWLKYSRNADDSYSLDGTTLFTTSQALAEKLADKDIVFYAFFSDEDIQSVPQTLNAWGWPVNEENQGGGNTDSDNRVNVVFSGGDLPITGKHVLYSSTDKEFYYGIGDMVPYGEPTGNYLLIESAPYISSYNANLLGWSFGYEKLNVGGGTEFTELNQKLYTTAEALAYIPSKGDLPADGNCLVFRANWKNVRNIMFMNANGRYSLVEWDGQPFITNGVGKLVAENTSIAEINASMNIINPFKETSDGQVTAAKFVGWVKYESGKDEQFYLTNKTLYSTAQALSMKAGAKNIMFLAVFDDDDVNNLPQVADEYGWPHESGEKVIENKVVATCVKDGSYEEVIYCKDCGYELSRTKVTYSDAANHVGNTVVKNKVNATTKADGYTGDTYCEDCGKLLKSGSKVNRLKEAVAFQKDQITEVKTQINDVLKQAASAPEGAETPKVKIDMEVSEGTVVTVIPAAILEEVKGKNVDVIFDMGEYKWTVSGKEIDKVAMKDINLEVTQNTTAAPQKVVSELAKDNKAVQFALTHEGAFGFAATLTMDAGADNSGKYANLYWYKEDGTVEFQTATLIKADGTVDLEFTHASDYIMVIGEKHTTEPTGNSTTEEKTENESDDGSEDKPQLTTKEQVVLLSPKTGEKNPAMPLIMIAVATIGFTVAMRKSRKK